MTTVDILFRYGKRPSPDALAAINAVHEVYGIRRLTFDEKARHVRIEYDATRLTAPLVANLLRRAGLDIVETIPLSSAASPEHAATSATASGSAPGAAPATPVADPAKSAASAPAVPRV